MMSTVTKLDPIVSEFDTQEEADSYDAWFREKVEKSMNSTEPNLSHDEAMAFVATELKRRRAARASCIE